MDLFVYNNPGMAHTDEESSTYVGASYARKRTRYGPRVEEQVVQFGSQNNASTLPVDDED